MSSNSLCRLNQPWTSCLHLSRAGITSGCCHGLLTWFFNFACWEWMAGLSFWVLQKIWTTVLKTSVTLQYLRTQLLCRLSSQHPGSAHVIWVTKSITEWVIKWICLPWKLKRCITSPKTLKSPDFIRHCRNLYPVPLTHDITLYFNSRRRLWLACVS